MSTAAPVDDAKLGLVVIGPVTLSYPNLFVPRVNKDEQTGEEKSSYDMELIIYDDNPRVNDIVQKAYAAVTAVAQAAYGQHWQHYLNQMMQSDKAPIRRLSRGKSFKPGDKDGFRIKAKSGRTIPVTKIDPNSPPNNRTLLPVKDAEEAYAGVQVLAEIKAHKYSHPRGGDGISWWAQQIVLVADGPRLGQSGRPPEEAFAEFNLAEFSGPMGVAAQNADQIARQMGGGMMMPGMPGPVGVPGMSMPSAVVTPPQQFGMPQQTMPPQIGMPAAAPPPVMNMPGVMPQTQPPGTMPGVPGMMPGQAPQGMPMMGGAPGMMPQMPGMMPTGQPGIQMPGMPGQPY